MWLAVVAQLGIPVTSCVEEWAQLLREANFQGLLGHFYCRTPSVASLELSSPVVCVDFRDELCLQGILNSCGICWLGLHSVL